MSLFIPPQLSPSCPHVSVYPPSAVSILSSCLHLRPAIQQDTLRLSRHGLQDAWLVPWSFTVVKGQHTFCLSSVFRCVSVRHEDPRWRQGWTLLMCFCRLLLLLTWIQSLFIIIRHEKAKAGDNAFILCLLAEYLRKHWMNFNKTCRN